MLLVMIWDKGVFFISKKGEKARLKEVSDARRNRKNKK